MPYASWDVSSGDRTAADEFAGALVSELLNKMRSHMRRQHPDFGHGTEEPPPAKAPKKRKKAATCVLCGETDAKYPPWEGICDHTLKERRGEHV